MARRASDPAVRPILIAVLDGAALGRAPGERARALFEAGVDWIQLRDRSLEATALVAVARALASARDRVAGAARRAGGADTPRVIVNKRCDVALAAGADGVHLGVDAVLVGSARALFRGAGRDRPTPGRSEDERGGAAGGGAVHGEATRSGVLVGVSMHSVTELERALAADEAPDYVHLAPIWSPRSKPAERPELGPRTLARAAGIALPTGVRVIAQGGLDAERAAEAVAAGAAGIAVTGLLTQTDDPGSAARALRTALDRTAAAAPRAVRSDEERRR